MALETGPWDVTEVLTSPEHIAAYLEAAMEENDPAFFRKAIQDVVRAIGMSTIAEQTGVARASLYQAFGDGGNPTLDTLTKVLKALGVRLAVTV